MTRRPQAKRTTRRDEPAPAFVLTAEDPLSPRLVMIWACVKNEDIIGALDEFNAIVQEIVGAEDFERAPDPVVQAAVQIAEDMEAMQSED